jgi:serine/threonine-protein kinase
MKQASGSSFRCAATSRSDGSHEPVGTSSIHGRARYQTQGILGMGGIGQVEHAFDLLLQRDVAIKTLHRRADQEPGRTNVDELRREARITCQLEHANILPVYELLEDDAGEHPALVMRLVQGETLLTRLQELGPGQHNQAALRPILDALAQVCDALSYAHAQGVLHLDLKPENVMIDASGHVFVLDWGEAVKGSYDSDGNLRPLERHRHALGTPHYMAPEQFEPSGPRVDQRTDVYALGGILYHAICGEAPFQDMDEERKGANPPLTVVPPRLDVRTPLLMRLVNVAMRALALDPAQRHAQISAFREDLTAIVREESFLPPLHFAPGACIVREGEPADIAYILLEGECGVCRRAGAADVTVANIHAGETFGESALLRDGLRTASVVARTHVSVLAFDRDAIHKAFGDGWVATFMTSLVARSNRSDPVRRADQI